MLRDPLQHKHPRPRRDFLCTLYFIRTCFFVLIILHFAVSFFTYSTQHKPPCPRLDVFLKILSYSDFFGFGVLHGVGKLADDVSETAVGPMFMSHSINVRRIGNAVLYWGGVDVGGVCGVEQGTSQGCLLYSVCTSSVFRSSS
jgi:hypothetical protein